MAEGEEQKTSEQGLSRVMTTVENAGSSVVGIADKLVDEMKNLVTVLGGKAEQAIGPATSIVTTLMTQYVEEQKAVVKREVVCGVFFGVVAVVMLLLCGACISVAILYQADSPTALGIIGAVLLGFLGFAFTLMSLGTIFDSFKMQAKITSMSVDKLISQSSRLRKGWE